jgi:hypothetical protein
MKTRIKEDARAVAALVRFALAALFVMLLAQCRHERVTNTEASKKENRLIELSLEEAYSVIKSMKAPSDLAKNLESPSSLIAVQSGAESQIKKLDERVFDEWVLERNMSAMESWLIDAFSLNRSEVSQTEILANFGPVRIGNAAPEIGNLLRASSVPSIDWSGATLDEIISFLDSEQVPITCKTTSDRKIWASSDGKVPLETVIMVIVSFYDLACYVESGGLVFTK